MVKQVAFLGNRVYTVLDRMALFRV